MYKQLISEQRSQIFALLQTKTPKKIIAQIVGVSLSTIYREIKRNQNKTGGYAHNAHEMAMERRERIVTNSAVKPEVLKEAIRLLKEKQWSPRQISGYLAKQGKRISHERIYQEIRADKTGELAKHTRHGMKYRHHINVKAKKPTKSTIKDRVSIHDRPAEADGTRFGDWELDTIVDANGNAIVTLTERLTNYSVMRYLPHGKKAEEAAKEIISLMFAFRGSILTITTDNGTEFSAHKIIAEKLKTVVYFADSYCSWQKGAIENYNKLVRQYIPKGTDLSTLSSSFIMEVQKKINDRPREKLDFSTPKIEFYKKIANFAVAS